MPEMPRPPAHRIAVLRYRGPAEVEFVDCVCGERVASLADWQLHLLANGRRPKLSNLGPAQPLLFSRPRVTKRT